MKAVAKHCSAFLAISLAVISPAHAQQFGLNMSESLDTLKAKGIKLRSEGSWIYSTPTLPYGNKMFNGYRLTVTPKAGLCNITGWISIPDSPYGDTTQDKFQILLGALSKKYGDPRKLDGLRAGSVWKEPRDWMMSLYQKERILSAFWLPKYGSRLPARTNAISLQALGFTSDRALISVAYEFENIDICLAERKKSAESNL